MIAWRAFVHDGQTYDLSHLHPQLINFTQKAKGEKPAREYEVQLVYSLHCFTRGCHADVATDNALAYSDSRETRLFDFGRYECSKQLPEIVRALPVSPCYHTGHGNFFTVKLFNALLGEEETYEVYFKASRSSTRPVRLTLFVQSAYVRDRAHGNPPSRKKINFFVILHNTLHRKPITMPK
jgi:hypothetical protein